MNILFFVFLLIAVPAFADDYAHDAAVNEALNSLSAQRPQAEMFLAQANTEDAPVTAVMETMPAKASTPEPVVAPQAAEETPTIFGDFMKEHNLSVSGSTTLDYYSSYIWRGQVLDRDSVVQPGVSLSVNNFTFGYWGNWDVENNDALNSSESDFYMGYSHAVTDYLTLGAGHTWYSFPGGHTSSKEYSLSASLPTLPFSPAFNFYHDYEDGKDLNTDGTGNYYSLGLSHSIPVNDRYGSTVELGLTGGYVDGQWLSGKGYHVTPTIGLSIAIAPNVSIVPTIGYNFPMKDLKDPNIGNQQNKFFSAVKTTYSF